ncbi:MAG: hypothetical protein M3140_00945 [Actinomycetota bacterium]|nr:hypothetical protein [Actinomycetota bacterium]
MTQEESTSAGSGGLAQTSGNDRGLVLPGLAAAALGWVLIFLGRRRGAHQG